MNRMIAYSLAASVLSLASCARMTGQSAPATAAKIEAEEEAKLCRTMSDKSNIVSQYPAVSQETLLSEIKAANQRLQDAVNDVRQSSEKISEPGILDVSAAYQSLQNTVDSIPGGRTTVGEASGDISMKASELQNAWNALFTNLECGA